MRTGGMVFLNWIDCFTALPFLSPAELLLCDRGSGRGEEPSGGESPPPDSDPFLMMVGFALWVYETLVVRFCACAVSLNTTRVRETGRSPRCRLKFQKRRQLFICTHNETLPCSW